MPAQPSKFAILAAFAAVYLIWGSTYLGILFAIQSIPPFLMAGVRYALAGTILFAIARVNGAPKPALETWRSALIIGACLLLCGNGGVTLSEKWVPTGIAALLVATIPIDMALLGWLTGITPAPTPMVWLGLLGGFTGVGVLVGGALTSHSHSPNNHFALGVLVLLFGSFVWSAGSLYSRQVKSAPSPLLAAGQQMLCGGGLLILAGIGFGEYRGFDPRQITSLSAVAFVYLVVIGALVGFPAYIFLLRHCDPAKVATYAYVNPIVALFLGTFFAGEHLATRTLFGAGLIIGSVAVVIAAQRIGPRPPAIMARSAPGCAR